MLRQGMWVLAVLFMGCDTRETVVVYSPHGVEMLSDYEGLFEAAYPDVDLQWLDMGSQDVFSRVSAERNPDRCAPPSTVWMLLAKVKTVSL